MRVLIVASEFPPGPGGIGRHAEALASHLARLGHEVTVAAPQPYVDATARRAFLDGAPYRFVELGGLPRLLDVPARIVRVLRAAGAADVVVGSGMSGLLAAWIGAVLRRRPLVAVAHGSEVAPTTSRVGRFRHAITARGLAAARAVVCVSRYTADLVVAAAPRARVVVVPNGAEPWSGTPARPDGVPDAPFVLTVGHVGERKGQDLVVRALPQVLARRPDVHYVVAGLATKGAELVAAAEHRGVGDRVHLLGPVEESEKAWLYDHAELFVLPARRTRSGDVEGYGIVIVEAALRGLPSVVAAGSGAAEAIADGVTGVVVPAEDPEALGAALGELLDDPVRRDRMAASAQQAAAEEGTWAHRIERYVAVLADAAAGAPSGRPDQDAADRLRSSARW
jgi:phosphatidylinositol alpha-1,6-mannosyltransferase